MRDGDGRKLVWMPLAAEVGFFDTIARDLTGRGLMGGSFQLRLILQPLIAILLGVRFGLRDAKAGLEPFYTRLRHAKGTRSAVMKSALRDALVALVIAFLLDCVLQYMTLKYVRPLAAVVVGGLLVWIPFSVVREVTNRLWRRRREHAHA